MSDLKMSMIRTILEMNDVEPVPGYSGEISIALASLPPPRIPESKSYIGVLPRSAHPS